MERRRNRLKKKKQLGTLMTVMMMKIYLQVSLNKRMNQYKSAEDMTYQLLMMSITKLHDFGLQVMMKTMKS